MTRRQATSLILVAGALAGTALELPAQGQSPRRLTLRKMKNAAIARIGAMNSATDAPSGMSLPQIAKVNAQVAKT